MRGHHAQPIWAKLARAGQSLPHAWHTLIDHSADVAAVFGAMLRVPVVNARLAALAGESRLPEVWLNRLAVYAALHDFGKANSGFQARWHADAPAIGHVGPALSLIYCGEEFADQIKTALPISELSEWGAFEQAFLSVVAHHGRPMDPEKALEGWSRHCDYWQPRDGYDPFAALSRLTDAIRQWFPAAFAKAGPPLPESTRFWHAVAGLMMLADWIGSDIASFPMTNGCEPDRMTWAREQAPRVLADYGFDPDGHRRAIARPVTFASISEHEPRNIQLAVAEADGQIVVLEAETGAGKTEAALYRFARLFVDGKVDGLYFALPTRVAATSLYYRVKSAVVRLFPEKARPAVILAVPGYVKADDVTARVLPGFDVQWDDDPDEATRRARWAAEHPKRFLAGTIAVGTIDQALLGAIQVKHAHLRSACLMRSLLVVDEVHASDTYMEWLLNHLLDQHARAGGHALLLSATLGSAARTRLLGRKVSEIPDVAEAAAMPYPAISTSSHPAPRQHAGRGTPKTVALALESRIGEPETVSRIALEYASEGAKVLVVRNTHRDAILTAEALFRLSPDNPALFRCNGIPTLHHGRFAREDRELLDAEIERQIGRDRPKGGLVLIGTQTLEQSLDIDADLLITDLCPADVLLQRLGRLHRHARSDRPNRCAKPRAIVLCPETLTSFLERGRHGLGGAHGPYRDVVGLEATRRLILRHPEWRIPEMNRLLVEHATHPQALEMLTRELEVVDPRWRDARQRIVGAGMSEVQLALQAALPWSARLSDRKAIFPQDESLATRLGAQDLAITLPDGLIGPFGTPIKLLSIPSFWLGGIDLGNDVEPRIDTIAQGRLTFRIQSEVFQYDRLGLRRGTGDGGGHSGS